MKKLVGVLTVCATLFLLPYNNTENHLKRYGIKTRDVGSTVTSKLASTMFTNRTYSELQLLKPYVLEASASSKVPPNVLMAILFEELVHRKPMEIRTHGVAQMGVGELQKQGLPPDESLLESDRLSVWMLGKKLQRLQKEHRSLQVAIIMHNGYYDYLPQIQNRAKDPKIKQILEEETTITVIDL